MAARLRPSTCARPRRWATSSRSCRGCWSNAWSASAKKSSPSSRRSGATLRRPRTSPCARCSSASARTNGTICAGVFNPPQPLATRRNRKESFSRAVSVPQLSYAPHPARIPPSPRRRGEGWGEGPLTSRVLYRDGLVLVIDKPAGIAVHPGPGGGPNLESGFAALRFGLPHSPALAHRLDRDTSGCLVLGRHPKALRRLGKLFAEGNTEKVYWAVVEGKPNAGEGVIDLPLGRLDANIGWWQKHDPKGQRA